MESRAFYSMYYYLQTSLVRSRLDKNSSVIFSRIDSIFLKYLSSDHWWYRSVEDIPNSHDAFSCIADCGQIHSHLLWVLTLEPVATVTWPQGGLARSLLPKVTPYGPFPCPQLRYWKPKYACSNLATNISLVIPVAAQDAETHMDFTHPRLLCGPCAALAEFSRDVCFSFALPASTTCLMDTLPQGNPVGSEFEVRSLGSGAAYAEPATCWFSAIRASSSCCRLDFSPTMIVLAIDVKCCLVRDLLTKFALRVTVLYLTSLELICDSAPVILLRIRWLSSLSLLSRHTVMIAWIISLLKILSGLKVACMLVYELEERENGPLYRIVPPKEIDVLLTSSRWSPHGAADSFRRGYAKEPHTKRCKGLMSQMLGAVMLGHWYLWAIHGKSYWVSSNCNIYFQWLLRPWCHHEPSRKDPRCLQCSRSAEFTVQRSLSHNNIDLRTTWRVNTIKFPAVYAKSLVEPGSSGQHDWFVVLEVEKPPTTDFSEIAVDLQPQIGGRDGSTIKDGRDWKTSFRSRELMRWTLGQGCIHLPTNRKRWSEMKWRCKFQVDMRAEVRPALYRALKQGHLCLQ